jgi:hypothetical protein
MGQSRRIDDLDQSGLRAGHPDRKMKGASARLADQKVPDAVVLMFADTIDCLTGQRMEKIGHDHVARPTPGIYDAASDEGGRSWARFASVIGTCRLNDVEPYAWMKATLEAIAAGHPKPDIDALLPWNFPKAAIKAAA